MPDINPITCTAEEAAHAFWLDLAPLGPDEMRASMESVPLDDPKRQQFFDACRALLEARRMMGEVSGDYVEGGFDPNGGGGPDGPDFD